MELRVVFRFHPSVNGLARNYEEGIERHPARILPEEVLRDRRVQEHRILHFTNHLAGAYVNSPVQQTVRFIDHCHTLQIVGLFREVEKFILPHKAGLEARSGNRADRRRCEKTSRQQQCLREGNGVSRARAELHPKAPLKVGPSGTNSAQQGIVDVEVIAEVGEHAGYGEFLLGVGWQIGAVGSARSPGGGFRIEIKVGVEAGSTRQYAGAVAFRTAVG